MNLIETASNAAQNNHLQLSKIVSKDWSSGYRIHLTPYVFAEVLLSKANLFQNNKVRF